MKIKLRRLDIFNSKINFRSIFSTSTILNLNVICYKEDNSSTISFYLLKLFCNRKAHQALRVMLYESKCIFFSLFPRIIKSIRRRRSFVTKRHFYSNLVLILILIKLPLFCTLYRYYTFVFYTKQKLRSLLIFNELSNF